MEQSEFKRQIHKWLNDCGGRIDKSERVVNLTILFAGFQSAGLTYEDMVEWVLCEITKVCTNPMSKKLAGWKGAVRHDINRALAVVWPPPPLGTATPEQLESAKTKPAVIYKAISGAEEAALYPDLDLSLFKDFEVTPMVDEDEFLKELGINDE